MSSFLSWDSNGTKAGYRQTLKFEDLLTLNMLARSYHAGFGYDMEKQYSHEPDALIMGSMLYPDLVSWDEEDDGYTSEINLEEAERMAKEYKLLHKKIILRLTPPGESAWNELPSPTKRTWFDDHDVVQKKMDWYELPVRSLKKGKPFVGPLSERPYIQVTEPYEEIEINKEGPVTIDDILFASRGLCCGPDRSVEEYRVLSDDGSVLMLQAEIDNWST